MKLGVNEQGGQKEDRTNKVRGIMKAGAQRGVKESLELGYQRGWNGSRRCM